MAIASFAPLFLSQTQSANFLIIKTLSIGIALSIITILYQLWKSERLLLLIIFLLVFRVEFNWFVLPDRNANDFGDVCRQSSIEVGKTFANQPLYLYKETQLQTTNSFYITNTRQEIVRRQMNNFDPKAVYIIDPWLYGDVPYEKVGELKLRHGKLTFDVGRLKLQK
jgi:hypothetical protein